MSALSTGHAPNGSTNGASQPQYTITGLKRWSCAERRIPKIEAIKSIHVYDFDNTLFASPLPNKQIWNGPTLGSLANPNLFLNGGWWHDASILAATGEGVEIEEPRAWKGWWNEQIVELVELSMQQKDVLTVLLTGRAEGPFAALILRMIKSKGLVFDLVCLKPAVGPAGQKFASTMIFKQELLRDLVFTYRAADEIRIYEDRPKHTLGFRNFFTEFNRALMSPGPPATRKTITVDVIQVPENATQLDPVTEVACIQRMINEHNLAVRNRSAPKLLRPLQIKRTVLYTGYQISSPFSDDLAQLVNTPPTASKDSIQILANSVLITPRPAPHHILEKIGGMGAHMRWRVTGLSVFENRIWAAKVEPVPAGKVYHTDNPTPMVVLALRRGARPADANKIQNWQPVPEAQTVEFDSVIGEKVLLRIDEEQDPRVLNWRNENVPPHKKQRRGFDTNNEQDFPRLGGAPPKGPSASSNQHQGNKGDEKKAQGSNGGNRGGGSQNRGRGGFQRGNGRGNRGAYRGGFSTGGGRGRGRGGQHAYKSLDDVTYGDAGGGGVYDGY